MEPLFLTLPGQKAWCAYVDSILSTQCIHLIFMDVMQFIYSTVFLSFFISSQHIKRISRILGFSSIAFSSIFLNGCDCGRQVLLSETLRNFTIYANVGQVTTELLLNSRELSRYKTTNEHFERLSDTSWLPSFSLCDSCSALLFLFSATVMAHGFTARYWIALWSDFLHPHPLLISFLRITCKCITGVRHCI